MLFMVFIFLREYLQLQSLNAHVISLDGVKVRVPGMVMVSFKVGSWEENSVVDGGRGHFIIKE